MNKIYKYKLQIEDFQVLTVPAGSKLLHIDKQGDDVCAWFMVNPTQKLQEHYHIHVFGTGHDVPAQIVDNYHTTLKFNNESVILHFFINSK